MSRRFKDDNSSGEESGDPETGNSDSGLIARRTVLRFGTVAAAGAGAAALIPSGTATPAGAAELGFAEPNAITPASSTNEAFGGVRVPPRALERWMFSTKPIRHVVCIGDSITSGKVGGFNYAMGGGGSWPERLGTAMGSALGPGLGYGFRGLWLRGLQPEWAIAGSWTETAPSDAFDVLPFAGGLYSSGGSSAILTWTKPGPVTVAGFDLYWFNMAGTGNWQYRVDNGAWLNMNQTLSPTDNKLHKFYVGQAVQTSVQIRAYNGGVACLAPIGGITLYSADPNAASGIIVHNLGAGAEYLSNLVRPSSGNPLAWFDGVVSNPPALGFRPDLVIAMFSNDVIANNTTKWKGNLSTFMNRMRPFADVVMVNPYEQENHSKAVQADYRAATLAIANTRRCAVLDLYDAYAASGAAGFTNAKKAGLMLDGLHPSQLGHTDISARVWRLLRHFS